MISELIVCCNFFNIFLNKMTRLLVFKLLVVIYSCMVYTIESVSYTYRCSNGKFIKNLYVCDGDNDCGDQSDEEMGCDRRRCGAGNFACRSDLKCFNISVRCNGVSECLDGSDEKDCGHELSLQNCTFEEGKFLCEDKLRCLRWNETCDGEENCYDGSDESSGCKQYDKDLCETCLHPCLTTPYGSQCMCRIGNETSDSCTAVNECEDFEKTCTQRCLKYREISACTCFENYQKGNGNSCYSTKPYGDIILYSTKKAIKIYNISSSHNFVIRNIDIQSPVTTMTGAKSEVYWALKRNNQVTKIFSASIYSNDSRKLSAIDLNTTEPVTSLSVDWITGNVYFILGKTISVCNKAGILCTRLMHEKLNIECVALAPKHGLMFWFRKTEKYIQPVIMKSTMDGLLDHWFIDEKLRFISSLAVDEIAERVYWYDSELMRIDSIGFNGGGRKIELTDAKHLSSFSVFVKMLYWTVDFSNKLMFQANSPILGGMSDYYPRIVENVVVNHVYVFNPLFQYTNISNPCASGPCKGLCLIRPSFGKVLDYTCLCNEFGSNRWCGDNEEEGSLTTERNIRFETTKPQQFIDNVKSEKKSSDDESHPIRNILIVAFLFSSVGIFGYYLYRNWYHNGLDEFRRRLFF